MSFDAFRHASRTIGYTVSVGAIACAIGSAATTLCEGPCDPLGYLSALRDATGLSLWTPEAVWNSFEYFPSTAADVISLGLQASGRGIAFAALVCYQVCCHFLASYLIPLFWATFTAWRSAYLLCSASIFFRGLFRLGCYFVGLYLSWLFLCWAHFRLSVEWVRHTSSMAFPTQIEKSIPSGVDFIGSVDPAETLEVTPESLLGAADFMVQGGYPLGMVEVQTFISLEGKTRISNPAGCGVVVKHNGAHVLVFTKHQANILLSALRAGGEVWVLGNAGKMQLPQSTSVAFKTSDTHDLMGLVVNNVFCSVVGVKPAELRLHRAATGTVAVYRRTMEGKLLYSIGEMTRVGNTIHFHHTCNTENHTSGSPVYLISGGRITVFGVHRGAVVGKAANIGTSLEFLLLAPKALSPVKVESEGYYSVSVPGSFWDEEATYYPNQKFYEEDDSDLYDHDAYTRPSGGMGVYDEAKCEPKRIAFSDQLRPTKPLPIPTASLDELEELECRPTPPPKPIKLRQLSSAVALEELNTSQEPPKVRVESTSGPLNLKSPQPGEGSPLSTSVNTSFQIQSKLSPKASASGKLVAQAPSKGAAVSRKGTNSSSGSRPSRSKARKKRKSKTGSSASASQ